MKAPQDNSLPQHEPQRSPLAAREDSAPAPTPSDMHVVCPRCHRPTEHLKAINTPNVVFLVAYIAWNSEAVTGCPECIRRFLGRRLLTSIPLANVAYPLVALVYGSQYLGSYAGGHSDAAVAEAHRMTRSDMLAQQEAAIHLNRPARREWVILAVLVLVIAGIWIGGLMLAPAAPTLEGKTVQQWTEQLLEGQQRDKLEAADALSRGGAMARAAISALRQTVQQDPDLVVRQRAYQALTKIDPGSTRGLPIPGFEAPFLRD